MMSKLEQRIAELCQNRIEYKTLSQLVSGTTQLEFRNRRL